MCTKRWASSPEDVGYRGSKVIGSGCSAVLVGESVKVRCADKLKGIVLC